jgi:hypothetical protein
MGADLYIRSVYEPNRARWEPEFEAAVRLRDSLPKDSPQRKAAQEEVNRRFEQMSSQGYFRDPYNDWDLLWKFRLSWWRDVIPMLDTEGGLSPKAAGQLLARLRDREATFEENLVELAPKEQRSFRERYTELQQFLKQAIALGETVDCSL